MVMLRDAQEIKMFQSAHLNHLGQPLEIDGVLGPQTMWAAGLLELPSQRQFTLGRCQVAQQRQVFEARGDNRHPFIDALNVEVNAPAGSAWCASFACWAIGYIKVTASAQQLGKSLDNVQYPTPGDVMWYPTGSWQGHCGIVIAVGKHDVLCLEGNRRNALRMVRRLQSEVRFGRVGPAGVPPWQMLPPPGIRLTRTKRALEGTR